MKGELVSVNESLHEWVSILEASKLPSFPSSTRGVRDRIERGSIQRVKKLLDAQGGIHKQFIHISELPKEDREIHLSRHDEFFGALLDDFAIITSSWRPDISGPVRHLCITAAMVELFGLDVIKNSLSTVEYINKLENGECV